MNFLCCAGTPLLAMWITAMRVWTVMEYAHTAHIFHAAMRKADSQEDNESARILKRLTMVFLTCALSGYGLLSFTVLGREVATVCYWLLGVALLTVNVWTHLLNRRLRLGVDRIAQLLTEGHAAIEKLKAMSKET